MHQMMMFGFEPIPGTSVRTQPRAGRRVRMENEGPTPQQKELNLKKLLRKIAFRRRTKEAKGIGNNESWSIEGIVRLHQVLCNDWEARFPLCTNPVDQFDWWIWMLGEETQNFSFRDCLIANGYTRPDDVIAACDANAPAWVKRVMAMEPDQQVEELRALAEAQGEVTPARKLLEQNTTLAA